MAKGHERMTDDLLKVNKHWSRSDPVRDDGNFYMSPLIRPYIIETAYGRDLIAEYQDNSYFAEDIFISKYLRDKKVESLLSLCCGFGSVERRFVSQLPGVKRCLGVDVATGALEAATKRAKDEKLNCVSYKCADLNNYPWEEEEYDLVIANGALHHLSNLEGALEGIRRTLRPDGLLYACEYVGPSYQNHSSRQLQVINAAAFLVPPELRARKGSPYFMSKQVFRFVSRLHSIASRQEKPEWPRWKKMIALTLRRLLNSRQEDFDFGVVHLSPKDMLLKRDPSECVRSSEIIPVVRSYFPNAEVRPFGGGILQHALDEAFYSRFDKRNPLHTKTLEVLCQLERHFMDTGEIGIENAFIIARKQ
jgi:ubiquinone/menaquinone biosynthesis C-methylase UbiE